MIKLDEDALICDLAETYNIYDYKTMPPNRVARFCIGLKEDSRIMLKMNNMKISTKLLLLADIRDKLSLLFWAKTKDGQSNKNRPFLMMSAIYGNDNKEDLEAFSSREDFEKERQRLIGGINGN